MSNWSCFDHGELCVPVQKEEAESKKGGDGRACAISAQLFFFFLLAQLPFPARYIYIHKYVFVSVCVFFFPSLCVSLLHLLLLSTCFRSGRKLQVCLLHGGYGP